MDVSSSFDPFDDGGPTEGPDGVVHHGGEVGPVAASLPVHDPLDNLWIADGNRIWDLGPADIDTDADGIADSLTRVGPQGVTVYTDADHDGRVDAITEVRNDGGFESRRLDATTGDWVRTDLGRLG